MAADDAQENAAPDTHTGELGHSKKPWRFSAWSQAGSVLQGQGLQQLICFGKP